MASSYLHHCAELPWCAFYQLSPKYHPAWNVHLEIKLQSVNVVGSLKFTQTHHDH
jgi:hypothetical protein